MEWLNLTPKAALLSRSNFGSGSAASGVKMRRALEIVREQAPDIEADGEMHGDCALDEGLRSKLLPMSPLKGAANLLVCPNVDAGISRTTCSRPRRAATWRWGRSCWASTRR